MESSNLMTIEEAIRKGLLKEGAYMDPRAILPDVESRNIVLSTKLSGYDKEQAIQGEILRFWNFFLDNEGKWCLLGAPTKNKFWLTRNGYPSEATDITCCNLYSYEECGIISRSMNYKDAFKLNFSFWFKILRDGGTSFLRLDGGLRNRVFYVNCFDTWEEDENIARFDGVRPVISLTEDILCDFSTGDGSSEKSTIKLVFA